MSDELNFVIGQPVMITPVSRQNATEFASRIIGVSSHTFTVSLPHDQGRLVLWPVGSRLAITISSAAGPVNFDSEIIDRSLGDTKSYTLMRPHAISRSAGRIPQARMSRVIAVTSGKGGVGKTTLTINLAIAMANQGKRVFIIDADLGTANVDILLRLTAKYNLTHLLSGDKNLLEIAVPAPGNIAVIPGGSGLQELTNMGESQFISIINSFNQLDGLADIILLDTGAGISKDVSNFLLAADEIIIVTTPEPHAITDAYAITKVMNRLGSQAKQMLIVNRAENQPEADIVANKLSSVVSQYLQRTLDYIGYVQEDPLIRRSLKQQNPLLLLSPQSQPAKNIEAIAARLLNKPVNNPAGITGFVTKMFSLFKK